MVRFKWIEYVSGFESLVGDPLPIILLAKSSENENRGPLEKPQVVSKSVEDRGLREGERPEVA